MTTMAPPIRIAHASTRDMSANWGIRVASTLPKAAICAATMKTEKRSDRTIITKRGPSPKRWPKYPATVYSSARRNCGATTRPEKMKCRYQPVETSSISTPQS